MNLGVGAFLFAVGVIGGAVNAVAGGGTLFTFPPMLAVGIDKLQEANALKNLLATIVTTIVVAIFVWADIVLWLESLAMLAGSLCGGYWGAVVARRMNEKVLRGAVIATGLVLTAYYFYV